MTNLLHLLIYVTYRKALYRLAVSINPEESPQPLPQHRLTDVWREEPVIEWLYSHLPEHYASDHTIVDVEVIDDVIVSNVK